MNLRAIQPIYRGGRLVQPGEPFDTTPEDGKALIQDGKARDPSAKKATARPARAEEQAEK